MRNDETRRTGGAAEGHGRGVAARGGGRGSARAALPLAALALAALLPACTAFDRGSYRVADTITSAGTAVGAPWGGMRPAAPEASVTVQRVRGGVPEVDQLLAEPGDVWPGPLPPRATLANPDAALHGVPTYEPAGRRDLQGQVSPPPGPPRGLPTARRGSGTPPPDPLLTPPDLPRGQAALPPPAPLPDRPPPRADGRVIHTPNGPVVTTGGTDRIQTFVAPGGGAGTAIQQGGSTILLGPDGRTQVVPNAAR
jgi:hypothetical protein